jgi:diamine N-acetyltransferase
MDQPVDVAGAPFIIFGERVALGVPYRELVPLCERWFNDLETTRTLGVNWHPIPSRAKGRYLDRILASEEPTFVIYERESRTPVGMCGLDDVNHEDGTAEFSIVIGDRGFHGRGLGTEATRLTLEYAFDVLGLHNVWLQVSANNPGAIRAYEKAGFRRIGIRRESVRIGRAYLDDVYMDAVATDFQPSALARLLHPPEEAG